MPRKKKQPTQQIEMHLPLSDADAAKAAAEAYEEERRAWQWIRDLGDEMHEKAMRDYYAGEGGHSEQQYRRLKKEYNRLTGKD